jgi:anti-sigma B factor antagonist
MPDDGFGAVVSHSKLPLAFRVTCHQEPTAFVIAVAGDIDLSTVTYFADALEGGVRVPSADVVVDMEDLTFIDATGLGALIRAHNLLDRQAGRRMIIRNVPRSARRLFELTGLHRIFDTGTVTSS